MFKWIKSFFGKKEKKAPVENNLTANILTPPPYPTAGFFDKSMMKPSIADDMKALKTVGYENKPPRKSKKKNKNVKRKNK